MDNVWLIAGLGNPGPEHMHNRHNVGFRTVDRLAEVLAVKFARQKHHALLASANRSGRNILLAKPQNYMNLSGQAIAGLVRYYRIRPECLLVCSDDIDLPLGTIRIRPFGGSGGQRGVQSVIDELGTQEFPRLRIGVGRPPDRMDPAAYVLQDFSPAEQAVVEEILQRSAQAVRTFLDEGLERAMTGYNGDGP